MIFLDFFQFQAHPNDEQQQIFYKKMKVLIACEYSGVVRDAFLANGHDAWSCDLLPTDSKGPHIQGDVLQILDKGWDLMIAHPPCTHLAASGARWFKNKEKEQKEDELKEKEQKGDELKGDESREIECENNIV